MKKENQNSIDNINIETIGGRITKARIDKGLSISQLALLTNKSYSLVRQYELGIRNPKDDAINDFAVALKVSPIWIKYGSHYVNEDSNGLAIYSYTSKKELNKIKNIGAQKDANDYHLTYEYNLMNIDSNLKVLENEGKYDYIDSLSKITDLLINNLKK